MADAPPVAIVGAGMAGLTAALSLARRGIASVILERAETLEEIGAGLQLSPNANRILDRLGVIPRLEPHWNEPDEIRLADGRSRDLLAAVPAGAFARRRWGAPYAVLHRAALQAALVDAVRAEPLCSLRLGTALPSGEPSTLARLIGHEPPLCIGADGVHSHVRKMIAGAGQRRFTGTVAWRWTVEGARAGGFDPAVVTAFLAPGAHLVAYPLGRTGAVNLVAVARGPAEPLSSEGPPQAVFERWHATLRRALPQAGEARAWPLYEVEDGAWQAGDRVLIGDAAHAITPFAAQGAAMAIEDGFALAEALAAGGTGALPGFVATRRARLARVRSRGAFNRFAYHAAGPLRLGRNLVLSLRSRESLAADLDWLYGGGPIGAPPR